MYKGYCFGHQVLEVVNGETIVARCEWYCDDKKAIYPWYRLDNNGKLRWVPAYEIDWAVAQTKGGIIPPPPCPEPPC